MPLDHKLFREHMRDASALAVVLKGHLWVESCVNRALEIGFARPDRREIDRLQFSAKLKLARATGSMRPDDIESLRKLNSLRNGVAHDLRHEIGLAEVEALEESLVGRLKRLRASVTQAEEPLDRLRLWFFVVLNILEFENMTMEYQKENHRKLEMVHLVRALSERLGMPDKSIEDLKREHQVPPEPLSEDAWFDYEETVPGLGY